MALLRTLVICLAINGILAVRSGQDARSRVRQGNGHGPWTSHLWLAEGADGLRFGTPRYLLNSATGPSLTVTAKGGILLVFQWFSSGPSSAYNQMAYVRSVDGGKTWSDPRRIEVRNVPKGFIVGGDPAIVPLDDGRLRLYFRGRPSDSRYFGTFSAISDDDVTFRFEP